MWWTYKWPAVLKYYWMLHKSAHHLTYFYNWIAIDWSIDLLNWPKSIGILSRGCKQWDGVHRKIQRWYYVKSLQNISISFCHIGKLFKQDGFQLIDWCFTDWWPLQAFAQHAPVCRFEKESRCPWGFRIRGLI